MADCLFARYQLEKHGWTEGAGLGKHENGRIDPIKVARKSNKDGVGHIPGSDLTTNWWDQAYNKAASKILVKTSTDGVTVHTTETKENNKKKSLLYARFVKGATLKATKGVTVEEPENSSDSDTEKEQIPPRLTDEEIFKICGGRTAHKAAGHGLKQNGKLQRIQEQERQYLESLNKEVDSLGSVPVSEPKQGKKRKRDAAEETEQIALNEEMDCQEELHRKKRKKEAQEDKEAMPVEDTTELIEYTKKEKKKKKKCKERKQEKGDRDEQVGENGKFRSTKKKQKKKCETEEDELEAVDAEKTVSHSEKKMKKKRHLEEAEKESEEASDVEIGDKKKQHKKEDGRETEEEFGELTKKKKKSRAKKERLEEAESTEKRRRKAQHEAEQEIEYAEENRNSIKTLDLSEVERKEERNKKHKKKKKKDHKKRQEIEKSFIKDEEQSVDVQQGEEKMEEEISENAFEQKSVKVKNSRKKVRFSLELVEVFTFSDDENDTSPQTP